MMIDKDVAYASPSTVYRDLKEAGMLQKKADDTSRGKGFKQPLRPHEQYVRSATRQLPRLFEIVLLLGYQLRIDDYAPAEQCLWKKHEASRMHGNHLPF